MSEDHRKPTAFPLGNDEDGAVKTRRRRTAQSPKIIFEVDEPALPAIPPAPLPRTRRIRWGKLLISSLVALVVLGGGLAASQLIEALFARWAVLGWLGLGLGALAGIAALALLFREIWGLMRLGKIERVQADAAHALNFDDLTSSRRAVSALKELYSGRPDTALGLKLLAELEGEIMDPADRVKLAEREILRPLDIEAHRIIARSARRVTLLTAFTPAAALDILFVAAFNLRMLRELATLYGGRPSTLATLRLARMVMSHLAVTGGLALSDSVIQHVVGKGLIGRLSARFGEGAVNGILTSRIGLAALEVCRPVPRAAQGREALTRIMREVLTFDSKEAPGEPDLPDER